MTDGSWAPGLVELAAQASAEYRSDIEHFESQLQEDAAAKKRDSAKSLQRVISTIEGRQLFAYFFRRNILPNYGFPVDTVELRVAGDADPRTSNLDLSRDVGTAINECVPGSAIVSHGKIIESAGVYRLHHKELVHRNYAVCQARDQLEVRNGWSVASPKRCIASSRRWPRGSARLIAGRRRAAIGAFACIETRRSRRNSGAPWSRTRCAAEVHQTERTLRVVPLT